MADQTNDTGFWAVVTALGGSLIVNLGIGIKHLLDLRSNRQTSDAQRVDAAHAQQVAELRDRVADNERRFDELIKEHRALSHQHVDCEKTKANLSGRICLLEVQAKECFEDRDEIRKQLAEIQQGN